MKKKNLAISLSIYRSLPSLIKKLVLQVAFKVKEGSSLCTLRNHLLVLISIWLFKMTEIVRVCFFATSTRSHDFYLMKNPLDTLTNTMGIPKHTQTKNRIPQNKHHGVKMMIELFL